MFIVDIICTSPTIKAATKKNALNRPSRPKLTVTQNQKFNKSEEKIHTLLQENSFKPLGKKALKTKYNTYIVTDNYLVDNQKETAIFISERRIENVIGSAILVKELVNNKINTLCIIGNPEYTQSVRSYNKELIRKYVDKIYFSYEQFENSLRAGSPTR